MGLGYLDRLDAAFWLTLSGGIFGMLGLCIRAILRSNCKEFSVCYGLVKCIREKDKTDIEFDDIRLRQLEMGMARTPPMTPQNIYPSTKIESQRSQSIDD